MLKCDIHIFLDVPAIWSFQKHAISNETASLWWFWLLSSLHTFCLLGIVAGTVASCSTVLFALPLFALCDPYQHRRDRESKRGRICTLKARRISFSKQRVHVRSYILRKCSSYLSLVEHFGKDKKRTSHSFSVDLSLVTSWAFARIAVERGGERPLRKLLRELRRRATRQRKPSEFCRECAGETKT